MGAWGIGPVDNDTAADWFFQLEKVPVPALVESGLNSKNQDEVRAAAYLLTKVGGGYMYPIDFREKHIDLAIEKIQDLYNNYDWISDWNNPDGVRKELEQELKALRDLK